MTAEFAMIVKYKMADANSDILFDSVHFLLNNWPVLQLAVQHGFGGKDSQEKAEWLVSVIDQVLRENGEHKSVFLPLYFYLTMKLSKFGFSTDGNNFNVNDLNFSGLSFATT